MPMDSKQVVHLTRQNRECKLKEKHHDQIHHH